MSDPISFHGIPRTSGEWAALAKIASGHPHLTKEELRALFMLGLVERQLERICLSRHGRETLGLGRAPSALAAPTATAHPQPAFIPTKVRLGLRNPGP